MSPSCIVLSCYLAISKTLSNYRCQLLSFNGDECFGMLYHVMHYVVEIQRPIILVKYSKFFIFFGNLFNPEQQLLKGERSLKLFFLKWLREGPGQKSQ